MPKPVRITGRASSITNSFVNGIIPVIQPTQAQIDAALALLGMSDRVECSYCGDTSTEWDHLRPLVLAKQPTGHISEIHNLVPACGKCNQSKGNKYWRTWMFSGARLSPATRGVRDIEQRAARLHDYEMSEAPTNVDFAQIAGQELWQQHWDNHAAILRMMREAEATADMIRQRNAGASSPPARLSAPDVLDAPVETSITVA